MSWKTNLTIRWLLSELNKWLDDGLINEKQAELIRGRYEVEEVRPWGKIIFTGIGAVLFGLGVILFFAYNWDAIPKFVKLALVFLMFGAAHGAALYFKQKENKAGLSEGLFILGSMLFGAAIWLIAQIYHIDEHYPNGLLVWGIGALILAWSLSSIPQCILALIILSFWHFFEVAEFSHVLHFTPVLILIFTLPLAWIKKSRVLLSTVLIAAVFSHLINIAELEGFVFMHLFYIVSLLLVIFFILNENKKLHEIISGLYFVGILPYYFMLYFFTFTDTCKWFIISPDISDLTIYYNIVFLCLIIISIVLWIIRIVKLRTWEKLRNEQGVIILSIFVISIMFFFIVYGKINEYEFDLLNRYSLAGLFNILLLLNSISLISEGIKRLSAKRVTMGVVFIALLAFSRYADLFESLMTRSIIFLIIGGFIFGIGIFYNRHKRNLEVK